MEYRNYIFTKDHADNSIISQLQSLSRKWEEEKTGPSYEVTPFEDFLNRPIFIVFSNNEVIAYAVGDIKKLEEATSYNKIGEKAFELDEIYVLPNYRDQGIGRNLYRFLESELKDQVDLIGVIAMSHRYKDLLDFYINELGMTFNQALLVKRV